MFKIYENLYIGSEKDYESLPNKSEWSIVQACKEPYHRKALGYTGRAASKEHPEYLMAIRENRLILNMVDADDYKYISTVIINPALIFIRDNIKKCPVLVHCNQGVSRSPSIVFLYLAQYTNYFTGLSLQQSFEKFGGEYPNYNPQPNGIKKFIALNWEYYSNHNSALH